MRFPRSSGILLPVFSLPGKYGIGDLGPGARTFVDFLQSAGQTIWQLLPLGPTAEGNSPYSSYSAFAGYPLLIRPELLIDDGLLAAEQASTGDFNRHHVDYEQAATIKQNLLRTAFENFKQTNNDQWQSEYSAFCDANQHWLPDFARFDAHRTAATADWSKWDAALIQRSPEALEQLDQQLADEIYLSKFVQYIFDRQWQQLKAYANERQVRIYGDMPIFVAYESVDVWTNQQIFCLDETGRPTVVAGVPPDYFSETGQMWGNPLYDWNKLAEDNYAWWTQRFRSALHSFDLLRIDHFRGFESYWEIPADAENAISGTWKKGPHEAPFHAAREALGDLPIVAEDLGLITDEVHHLRDRLQFPGMRVLQFGFYREDDPYHRPDHYPENSVAYTGTHDNDTTMGWYSRQMAEHNPIVERFVHDDEQPHTQLIKSVLNSSADTAIIPMQDVLGLGNDTRMNTPGEPDGNWTWRCSAEALNSEVGQQLRSMCEHSART